MFARKTYFGILILGALLSNPLSPAFAQQEVNESTRKVVNRVEPMYPDFARRMALKGTVRLEAVVATTGKVKVVNIKGGHPLLAQAAARAVSNWKWEASSAETHEVVEVQFSPQ